MSLEVVAIDLEPLETVAELIAGPYVPLPDPMQNLKFAGSTEPESAAGVTGASPAFAANLDLDFGRHALDASALVTGDTLAVTVTNDKAAGVGVRSVVVVFITGADAGFTLAMPAEFGAVALNAGVETWVVWETRDDGATWRAFVAGEF